MEILETILLAMIYVPLMAFRALGVRGLLEKDGYCGWGWCSPTMLGWTVLAVFWLVILAAVGVVIYRLRKKGASLR